MAKIEIYCVTNVKLKHLEQLNLNLAAVGNKKFSERYISSLQGKNIQTKEKNYSELTFHYWFWKNQLNSCNDNDWIGFCQKRRFWLSSKDVNLNENISNILLKKIPNEWEKYESVLCEPVQLGTKLTKLLKRGWRNVLEKPSLLFNHHFISIKLQFDLHHGYGVLDKAINEMNDKDKFDFLEFVEKKTTYNPHIMFISKKKILSKFFKDQFEWLFKCEKVFGLENLRDYDQTRLYAFLAERYVPFWFKKYSKTIEWPWIFSDKHLSD